jgi:hypothetical protein
MPGARLFVLPAMVLAALAVPARPSQAQPRPVAPVTASVEDLLDMPECATLETYVSPQELAVLRSARLTPATIAALALLAHHTGQPVGDVARKYRAGQSLATLATGAGVDPKALAEASRQLVPGSAAEQTEARRPAASAHRRMAQARLGR